MKKIFALVIIFSIIMLAVPHLYKKEETEGVLKPVSDETNKEKIIYSKTYLGSMLSLGMLNDIFKKSSVTVQEAKTKEESYIYKVWYGTNRKPEDESDISKGFTGDRDKKINYGTANVYIPESHKFGSLGSNIVVRTFTLTDDRLKLREVQGMNSGDYWSDINLALNSFDPNETHALIYIHGYNVTFEEAAIRAAQIGYDLKINGVTSFFSWPSNGKFPSYARDEANIIASEKYIEEYLTKFSKKVKADKIHVIAHSMGNRGFARALQRMSLASDDTKKFNQIILAAPDIDVDLFYDLAGVYSKFSDQTTMYVSKKDKAVGLSQWLHDFDRAGFVPPVTVVDKIVTIAIENMDVGLLGHSYYAEAKPVLCDIRSLIQDNLLPSSRPLLYHSFNDKNLQYWLFEDKAQDTLNKSSGCTA